uniref:BTB domain-containing protein n=1 Tax=Palpitomonas bilix TaxID=652834 RepID=A0A7S3DC47_9EUKA|mmetsp:Transcript_30734/g.80370  ORF Transcript_30734/g.80370 Transcript_30734/m.80370 type:complete len:1138 (+) Transcript_30734:181-3594(+)
MELDNEPRHRHLLQGLSAYQSLEAMQQRHERGREAEAPPTFSRAREIFVGDEENCTCFDCGGRLAVDDRDVDLDRAADVVREGGSRGRVMRAWVCTKFGIFLCSMCAGNHRKIGVDVSFVRSPCFDTLLDSHLIALERGGNRRARHEIPDIYRPPPHILYFDLTDDRSLSTQSEDEQRRYMRSLYSSPAYDAYRRQLQDEVLEEVAEKKRQVATEVEAMEVVPDIDLSNFFGYAGTQAGLITGVSGGAERREDAYEGYGEVDGSEGRADLTLDVSAPLISVSAGMSFAAATTEDGEVYVWGEVGTDRHGLAAVFGETAAMPIANAVKSDRTGVMYTPRVVRVSDSVVEKEQAEEEKGEGGGERGRDASSSSTSLLPSSLLQWRGSSFTMVTCGQTHVVALTDAGGCYTWGDGYSFRLGHGTEMCETKPRLVARLAELKQQIVHAAAGPSFTVVVSSTGTVYSWGESYAGALGLTGTRSARLPEAVNVHQEDPRFRAVFASCSGSFVLAISISDKLYGWGDSASGQLGINRSGRHDMHPERVRIHLVFEEEDTLKQVSCGKCHVLYMTEAGRVYFRGLQKGASQQSAGRDKMKKVEWFGPNSKCGRAVAVAAGDGVSYVLTDVHEVYTWGLHLQGGKWKYVDTPMLVEGLSADSLVSISCGSGDTDLVYLKGNAVSDGWHTQRALSQLWEGAQAPTSADGSPSAGGDMEVRIGEGKTLCLHSFLIAALAPSLLAELKKAEVGGVVDLSGGEEVEEKGQTGKGGCIHALSAAPADDVLSFFSFFYSRLTRASTVKDALLMLDSRLRMFLPDADYWWLSAALEGAEMKSKEKREKRRGERRKGRVELKVGKSEGGRAENSENEAREGRGVFKMGKMLDVLGKKVQNKLEAALALAKQSVHALPHLDRDRRGSGKKVSLFKMERLRQDRMKEKEQLTTFISSRLTSQLIAMNTTSEHGCDDEGDFALIVRHVKLRCHKAMLASDFFAAAFAAGLKEAKEGVMVVSEEGISPSAAFVFLDLLYGAPFILSSDSPLALLNDHLSVAGLDEVKAEDLPSVCEAVQLMAGLYSLDRVGVAAANLCILSTLTDANFCTAAEVVTAACEEDLTSKLKWKLDGSSHILFKDKAHSILESILDGREEEE